MSYGIKHAITNQWFSGFAPDGKVTWGGKAIAFDSSEQAWMQLHLLVRRGETDYFRADVELKVKQED